MYLQKVQTALLGKKLHLLKMDWKSKLKVQDLPLTLNQTTVLRIWKSYAAAYYTNFLMMTTICNMYKTTIHPA